MVYHLIYQNLNYCPDSQHVSKNKHLQSNSQDKMCLSWISCINVSGLYWTIFSILRIYIKYSLQQSLPKVHKYSLKAWDPSYIWLNILRLRQGLIQSNYLYTSVKVTLLRHEFLLFLCILSSGHYLYRDNKNWPGNWKQSFWKFL